MSFWGNFYIDDEVHIVPVDKHGGVIGNHELKEACQCRPKHDEEYDHILIHQDIEKTHH